MEDILKNSLFRRYFPPVVGVIFVGLFVSLGMWQLDRAEQKKTSLTQFADDSAYAPLNGQIPDRPFQPVVTSGRYLGGRQVLIENIVRNGRVGYFVVSPLEIPGEESLLLVNRGWLPRTDDDDRQALTTVNDTVREIRGRASQLPRVSIRAGEGFAGATGWPRSATYPTLEEVAAELGVPLLPFVILLDPGEADGFDRQWQPQQSGPMTNYGYAFQWFAMAAAVLAIMLWRFRRRNHDE